MKKHVAGLVLFCFVVGSAAFIAEALDILTDRRVRPGLGDEVRYPDVRMPVQEMKSYPVDKKLTVVRQAVINTASKELKVELLFNDDFVAAGQKSCVRLNYFQNDKNGLRFLTSETFFFFRKPTPDENKGKTAFVTSAYKWLNQLDSYENLYVTVESIGVDYDLKNASAPFDAESAKEITVEWGSSNDPESSNLNLFFPGKFFSFENASLKLRARSSTHRSSRQVSSLHFLF